MGTATHLERKIRDNKVEFLPEFILARLDLRARLRREPDGLLGHECEQKPVAAHETFTKRSPRARKTAKQGHANDLCVLGNILWR